MSHQQFSVEGADPSRLGTASLRRLYAMAGILDFDVQVATRLFESLTGSWLPHFEPGSNDWYSDISDDGAPIELSVALGGKSELRLLVEAQGRDMSSRGSFEAAKQLNLHLEQNYGANLERFAVVEDIFAPEPNAQPRFTLWHAGVARKNGELAFKAYFNPNIHGPAQACSVVKEALSRLGLSHAREFFEELEQSYRGHLECLYFSLDLDDRQGSRVKLYIPHRDATLTSLEKELEPTLGVTRWDARQTLRTLAGHGPLSNRPVLSCFGFFEGKKQPQHTMHVPVRCYSPNDEEAMRRLDSLATSDIALMARKVAQITAERPLSLDRGHITYISTKRSEKDVHVTLYLASGEEAAMQHEARSTLRVRTIPEHQGTPSDEGKP